MIREFLFAGTARQLAFAWIGLFVFVSHSFFKAWLKWALNGWYTDFYDILGSAGGSAGGSEGNTTLAEKRQAVSEKLLAFGVIVAPAIVVHPVANWIASVWRFTWRIALVRSYLAHYDVRASPVEGAAQRIQEDTARFEQGIYACFSTLLDSLLTLGVFLPVLLDVGKEAHLPRWDWPPWLILVASASAVGGLAVSVVVGHPLVELEVSNQRVEASFRTRLVMLEQRPSAVVGGEMSGEQICDELHFDDIIERPPPPRAIAPLAAFHASLAQLWKNYRNLYRSFAYFNTWIAFYNQVMVVLPFVLVAPLMFAEEPSNRISLGTLMRVSNAFEKVFSALAVVTENWSAVNEFRSTVRRLREFENATYAKKRFDSSLLRDYADKHSSSDWNRSNSSSPSTCSTTSSTNSSTNPSTNPSTISSTTETPEITPPIVERQTEMHQLHESQNPLRTPRFLQTPRPMRPMRPPRPIRPPRPPHTPRNWRQLHEA